jgi:glutamate/aspartate transport system permease protein
VESFDGSVLWFSLPYLWKGLQYSLFLTFTAMVGGIICGSFLARVTKFGERPESLFGERPESLMAENGQSLGERPE